MTERKLDASAAALTAAPVTPLPQASAPSDAPPPRVTAPATPAAGFVSSFLARAFRIARDPSLNPPQRRSALAKLFADSMDMSRIAGITAGDGLTAESADFQSRFRSILVSYLVETYYPQIEVAADPSVKVDTIAATPLADGTAVVWTTFNKSDWVSQSVEWRLNPIGGGYRIADIYTAGVSLVQMERDTFHSVMRNGGLPELMAKLDARTKALADAATE
jgi:ABC-type transporter MlaC component